MPRRPDLPILSRAAALLVLMGAVLGFRLYFSTSVLPPPARMQGEATQAYRYARLVSLGEGIPETDPLAMHPRGFPTGQNSIFQEYIAGGLHRIIRGDFDGFLRLFCLIFPLLAIPGLFLWMKAAGFSSGRALLGAGVYGIIPPAILRARGESLYRETVALPLIVFLGWALEKAIEPSSRRTGWAVLAGVLLFASLAAWKVTGFLSAFLFLYLLFSRRVPRDPRLLVTLGVAQLAGALLLSHMRHDGALLSPATILAVFTMISSIPLRRLSPVLPWAGAAIALAGAVFASDSGGHVIGVAAAKIRFLFRHPENPLLLSPDARLFWVGGYTSPAPGQILLLFGPPAALALMGLKRFLKLASGRILIPFLLISIPAYLFFDRLHVFTAVALAPVIALSVKKRLPLLLVMAALASHALFFPGFSRILQTAGLPMGSQGASLLTGDELDSYLEWLEESTLPDQGFLAYWHLSGFISGYGERPTVLHTFFENRENRRNIVGFARVLFQAEEDLVRFMEDNEAEYLVYQADFLLDMSWQGVAYLGGVTGVDESSVAFSLQYRPETLERLFPVWQGESLRVFRLDGTPSMPRPVPPLFNGRYRRFFDYEGALSLVADPVGTGLALASRGMALTDPCAVSAGLLILSRNSFRVPTDAAIGPLQFLVQAHLSGDYGMLELEEDFLAYLHGWGPDPEVRLDLVYLLERAGLEERARHHFEELSREGRGL